MIKVSFVATTIAVILSLLAVFQTQVSAQTLPVTTGSTIEALDDASASASESALTASESAQASTSAVVEEKIEQKAESDITETRGAVKSRLAQYLDDNPIGPLGITNFAQHAIRNAVNNGVPANMIVLLLMFPVIASLIAFSRHVIGLQGFGIYTPAVLAVVFLSTGIVTGIILFSLIILSAVIGRFIFGYLKLQYLPRTALVLWFVSLGIFGLLLLSPFLIDYINLVVVGIFPILVLTLLSENFISSQQSVNQARLLEIALETVLLAVGSALVMDMNIVQQFVILHPEFTILIVAAFDMVIGRYTGLRITEYLRFRPILREDIEE